MTNTKEPVNNIKYDKMGVNPAELYMRQNGLCWLELVEYEVNGKPFLDGLYCTDGKEYAETSKMLNPTFECAQCMSRFILQEVIKMKKDKEENNNIMKLLMDVLVCAQASKKAGDVVSFTMDIDTFLYIEKFMERNTMYSDAAPPIKNNGAAKSIFGISVIVNNKEEPNTIRVKPNNRIFRFEK